MKTCKTCKTEIHEDAKKCPHCQSFQQWWYAFIPVLPVLLLLLPFMILPRLVFNSHDALDFKDLDGKVSFEKISEEIIKSENEKVAPKLKIIIEMKNHTDRNLERPNFEILVKDSEGKVRDVDSKTAHNAKLPANETTIVALTLNPFLAGENFSTELKLTEIKED